MVIRRSALALMLMGSCACMAQTKYNGQLEPGLSTMDDAERVLGKPLNALSKTRFEYPPPAGASKLRIDFLGRTVNLIHVEFQKPYDRGALTQAMKLPERPQTSKTSDCGYMVEYYGAPALIALSYSSTQTSSGVTSLLYYSPTSFAMASQIPLQSCAGANKKGS